MIPPELLDHIFSFLQGDHATLKLCAQVNSVFSNLVEPHLHAQLTFNYASTNRHIFKFSHLLSDRPQIANYVRRLTIEVVNKRYNPDQSVSDIWHKLLRLEVITLTFRTTTAWLGVSLYFRRAFADCIALSSLCEVILRGINNFPLSILGGNKSIRRLVLDGTWVSTSEEEEALFSECSGLSSLSLYHLKSFIIVLWAKMQNLRTISLRVKLQSRGMMILIDQLFKVSSKSLTCLEIDFGQEFRTKYDLIGGKFTPNTSVSQIQLPFPRKLETLVICASMATSYKRDFSHAEGDPIENLEYMSSLPAIVKWVETAPPVKCIAFHFNFHLEGPFSLRDVDWSRLAHIADVFASSLQRINLHLSAKTRQLGHDIGLHPSKVRSLIQGEPILGKMVGQGVLVIWAEEFVFDPLKNEFE